MGAGDEGQSAFAVLSKAFTVITAVLGLLVALTNVVKGSEDIERDLAEDFLKIYAAVAANTPDYALEQFTTQDFKAGERGRQPDYRNFWLKVDDVTDATVVRAANGDKNYFDVKFKLDYEAGGSEQVASSWHLVCDNPFRKYNPFIECRAEDLRLDDVVRLEAEGQ
jgi:hypothetical protein